MTTLDEDYPHNESQVEAEAYFEAQRGWTWRRVILVLVTLLLIALLLVYIVLPAIEYWATPLPNRPLLPPINL